VAAEHPDVVKQFEDYLAGARVDSPRWPITPRPARNGGRRGGRGN